MIVSLETFTGYTGSHEDDALSTLYLQSAEEIVRKYLGYDLSTREYTTYLSGGDGLSIILKAKPIAALISLSIDGVAQDLTIFEIDGETIASLNESVKFTRGYKNIKAVYTAGYVETEIPSLIKMVIMRIAALHNTEAGGNIGITSKSFGDSGNRTFMRTTDYEPYLIQLSEYKLLG